MFTITVRKRFSASHALRGYDGPCARVHGHNFRVEAEISGETLGPGDMLVDFVAVDRALDELLEALDHGFLNETPPFRSENPTAESLARHLHDALARALVLPPGVRVAAVTVHETDDYRARYEGPR